MKIQNIRTFAGPNMFHSKPVLIMTIDLENLTDTHSADLEGFTQSLLEALPGLKLHRCSPGYPGGFVERLNRGTYFAHIIEHIALEISGLVHPSIEVGYGKSVYAGRESLYKVVVRFKSENVMKEILKVSVAFAEALANKDLSYPLQQKISALRMQTEDEALGPSTQSIVDAAIKRNIPYRRLNSASLIQFGYGKQRKIIQATTSSNTGYIAVDIAQDKNLTKSLLERAGIRVPKGQLVHSVEEAVEAFEELNCAVAIKPVDAQQGKGISLNITSKDVVRKAYELAAQISTPVIIEEFIRGSDYRVLVVGSKVVAAAKRVPAFVVGDGESDLMKLINKENENPKRGEGHEKPMTKIKINQILHQYLERKNISLFDVPKKDETVYLRDTANLSTGGSSIDVTDIIHPDIAFMCVRAAQVVGLDICGVDLMAQDISKSLDQELGIVEVNASPGIRMHLYPAEGSPRAVGNAILTHLYPQAEQPRLPVISITGTNGKTTVTRLISFIFSQAGHTVGMTSSDGVYIGKNKILSGDTSGPASAQAVLNDPSVDVAVLETARGGIIRRGLGYDQCGVGVITNISEDHIGQDGIESVEDILKVKSIVADSVAQDGVLVLNADDPHLVNLAKSQIDKRGSKHIILFSMSCENEFLIEHANKGGCAYYFAEGKIFECRNHYENEVVDVSHIPITLNGLAQFQIANAMTAIAVARSQNVELDTVAKAVQKFKSKDNHGRMNIYKTDKGFVIMDYGHNPGAYTALSSVAKSWRGKVSCVVGLPGDRRDDVLIQSAKILADQFKKIVIHEEKDLRGRKPFEMSSLLKNAVLKYSAKHQCEIILDEQMAVETAANDMEFGELVFVFYDDKHAVESALKKIKASEVDSLVQPTIEKTQVRSRPFINTPAPLLPFKPMISQDVKAHRYL